MGEHGPARPQRTAGGHQTLPLRKIVSGGQTGVDRAALDVACELGIACGGWCPRGRRAEDGRIAEIYPLRETESADYSERTERNVEDADGTLVITNGPITGGTALTVRCARRLGKPLLIVDLREGGAERWVRELQDWVLRNQIRVLNVAGPRESQQPGIYDAARRLLTVVLTSGRSMTCDDDAPAPGGPSPSA